MSKKETIFYTQESREIDVPIFSCPFIWISFSWLLSILPRSVGPHGRSSASWTWWNRETGARTQPGWIEHFKAFRKTNRERLAKSPWWPTKTMEPLVWRNQYLFAPLHGFWKQLWNQKCAELRYLLSIWIQCTAMHIRGQEISWKGYCLSSSTFP